MDTNKKRLVEENIRLAYYTARKFYNTLYEEDELNAYAIIGLIKAAITFDESKNIKFATYSYRCIENEILMYLRREKKHIQDVSLEDILNVDRDGNESTLSDIIPDPKSDFIQPMIASDDYAEIISIIFNSLKKLYRLTLLYFLGEKSQKETGDILGISQSYVSRILKKAMLQIKNYRNLSLKNINFKEIFSIRLDTDRFYISFLNSDVPYFHQAYATLLKNNPNIATLINFLDNSNKKRTFFCMLNVPQSYILIAEIFQEIDKISANQINKPVDSLEIIRNYFLSLEFFTIKELTARFPNEKTFLIRSAVHLAEIKGLITPLGKGNYIVNKTKP